MKRHILRACFAALIAFAFPGSVYCEIVQAAPSASVDVNVRPDYVLRLTLANTTSHTLRVSSEVFARPHIHLFIVENRPLGRQLDEHFDLYNPVSAIIKLMPGEQLTKEVDLRDYFPGIEDNNAESELLIMWAVTIDNRVRRTFGGVLTLPRRE